jgi:hypothetical protein
MVNAASGYPLGSFTGPTGIAGLIAFPLGWAALGLDAIRLERPARLARPA